MQAGGDSTQNTARRELDGRLTAAMGRAQGGDRAAYDLVLRESAPVVRRIARARGCPADVLDDVVQDVLITIHGARAAFDPSRSYLAWLGVIAQRRTIDLLRKRGRRAALETHDEIAYDTAAGADDPARDAERHSEARRLRDAVGTLPPVQREAVETLALGESSLEDASKSTGRTKTALKVNLHRAIASLRTRMGAEPRDEPRPHDGEDG